ARRDARLAGDRLRGQRARLGVAQVERELFDAHRLRELAAEVDEPAVPHLRVGLGRREQQDRPVLHLAIVPPSPRPDARIPPPPRAPDPSRRCPRAPPSPHPPPPPPPPARPP